MTPSAALTAQDGCDTFIRECGEFSGNDPLALMRPRETPARCKGRNQPSPLPFVGEGEGESEGEALKGVPRDH